MRKALAAAFGATFEKNPYRFLREIVDLERARTTSHDHLMVVIGPGDEIVIRAWGQVDINYRATIDRNGAIHIPQIGSLTVGGLRYQDLHGFMRSAIGRVVLKVSPEQTGLREVPELALEDGDRFFIPSRPSTVGVMGSVYNQTSFVYEPTKRVNDYMQLANQPIKGAQGADYLNRFRDFKYQETLFELMAKQYEMARLDEAREGAVIQVVDFAVIPERKSKPKRALAAGIPRSSANPQQHGAIRSLSWRQNSPPFAPLMRNAPVSCSAVDGGRGPLLRAAGTGQLCKAGRGVAGWGRGLWEPQLAGIGDMRSSFDDKIASSLFQGGNMTDYRSIITLEPGKRGGKPCIRGLRIAVQDVLGWLASGMSIDEIIADYPELTKEDVLACLAYATDREKHAAWVRVAA